MISVGGYNRFVSDPDNAIGLLPWLAAVTLGLATLSAALSLLLVDHQRSFPVAAAVAPVVIAGTLGLFSFRYIVKLLSPMAPLQHSPVLRTDAARVWRRLARYNRHYWSLLFGLAALSVPVQLAIAELSWQQQLSYTLLLLSLLILMGMPVYFIALDCLGTLIAPYGLVRIQVSLKSKIIMLGVISPLFASLILAQYYLAAGGELRADLIMVWLILAMVSVLVTAATIANLNKALSPVQALMAGRKKTGYAELAALRPNSTDEIGYLAHTLGRLARRLMEKNAHIRAIFEAAGEGIVLLAADGRIQTVNPAAERLFGLRNPALRGKHIRMLLPTLEMAKVMQNLCSGGCEMLGNYRGERVLTMSVRLSQLTLAGQRMYVCMVTDISARKAAEHERQEAEVRYRDLVETSHDMVWSLDVHGRWSYVNDAVRHIYGCSAATMIGKPFQCYAEGDHYALDQEMLTRMREGEEVIHYETVHQGCDGRPRYLSFNGKAQRNTEGEVMQFLGSARDITEKKAYEQQLYYQAQHDSLTGLYNRNYFRQELERVVPRVVRSGAECALLYIDLDKFKCVNDTVGHSAGDRLLIEVTKMCRAQLREGDVMGRLGGDEFTILLYDVNEEAALKVAEKLRDAFERYQFIEADKHFNITCSLGMTLITSISKDADEVMAHADLACNAAKTQGRNKVVMYDAAQLQMPYLVENSGWASRVRNAVEEGLFRLVYQPIVSLKQPDMRSYEVLIRMREQGGEILPGGFIPAAERFGLMQNVDRWMVREVIARLADINRSAPIPVRFSMNLSGRALEEPNFVAVIQQALEGSGVPAELITFEISEASVMSRIASAGHFIEEIRALGCKVALDDFGVGFSSLSFLKQLPVDILKIDGSYISRLTESDVDQAMVQSIAQVARAMGKVTVAESVEDGATLTLLKKMGVDYVQGYYLGRPESEPR